MQFENDTLLFNDNEAIFLFKIINGTSEQVLKVISEFINSDYHVTANQFGVYLFFRRLCSFRSSIQFDRIISQNLSLNLQMIDSQLPELLASVLLYAVKVGVTRWTDIVSVLNVFNPLSINKKLFNFYNFKITRFLVEAAFGLNSAQIFKGISSELLFVYKDKLETLKYHRVYNKNLLEGFLLNRTQLSNIVNYNDWIYEENGNYYVKLNLRIKFILG